MHNHRLSALRPYSLPRLGFPASEGREAPSPERSDLRWRLRNPRADFVGAKASQRYVSSTVHAPFRDEFLRPIVATIGKDFRAKRCALTLDESLQMMSSKDSFYKDFASGQSCVSVIKPHLF